MSFPYEHILVIGATSGIGKAMSDRFIAEGKKVIAVGRRQDRLDAFVKQHGSDKASSIAFDIANLDGIPMFIDDAFKSHPTIDCIFLNAATQSPSNFLNPSSVSMSAFQQTLTVNFTSQVAIVHAALPYFLSPKPPSTTKPAALLFTGTPISLIPCYPLPSYSSSKAALESFFLCLREQLSSTNISVLQISPGPVQTELHNPEGGAPAAYGMPLEDFVTEAYEGLREGRKDVYPGLVGGSTREEWEALVKGRDEALGRLSGVVRKVFG